MAGAPCPVEVMKKVIDRMHARDVTIAYGMTETSSRSVSRPRRPIRSNAACPPSGRVQPHLEVKISSTPRAGSSLAAPPANSAPAGYSVMLGYWDDAEKDRRRTRRRLDAHRRSRGDRCGKAGYANIVGRLKDMIIRGGENIYPREIEEFLYTHPKIQDVQIVGIPDPKFGETVCAWIRLKSGERADADEITAFCRGRIAHFKVPHHIRFRRRLPHDRHRQGAEVRNPPGDDRGAGVGGGGADGGEF